MARVPRLTDTSQRLTGVTGGIQRRETNASAFGASTAQAATGLAEQGFQLANEIEIRQDEAEAKNADTEFSTRIEAIRTQVMARRGSDAIDNHDKSIEELTKARADIEANLKTDRQKRLFKAAADARQSRSTQVFNNHLLRQQEQFHNDASSARIENQKREASANFADPTAARVSIQVGLNEIRDMADRNGWSDDRTKLEISNFESESHAGIISAKLSAKDTAGARKWFASFGSKLTPTVRNRVQSALKESGLRADSQAKADAIMAQTNLTDKQREDKARAIKNPELRDATLQRVRQNNDRNLQLEKRAEQQVDDRVLTKIYDGDITSRDDVDPTDWAGMSTRGKGAVINMLKKGFRPVSDRDTWSMFFNMDDDKFKDVNLQLFMDKLSRSDLEQFKKRQDKIRLNPDSIKFQTQTLPQKIRNALDEAKITGKTEQGKADRAKFERVVSERVAMEQRRKKRKLEPDEIDKIINRNLLTVNVNSVFDDPKLFQVLGTPNEAEGFQNIVVPDSAKQSIIKQLNKVGYSTSEANIRLFYIRSTGIPEDVIQKHFPEYRKFKEDLRAAGNK